jgi:hypothetical protein
VGDGIPSPGCIEANAQGSPPNGFQSDLHTTGRAGGYDSEVRERLGVRPGIAVPIVDSEKDVIDFFEIYNKEGSAGFTSV